MIIYDVMILFLVNIITIEQIGTITLYCFVTLCCAPYAKACDCDVNLPAGYQIPCSPVSLWSITAREYPLEVVDHAPHALCVSECASV